MDEKQLKDLMVDLADRGFADDTLEKDISAYAALGLPLFSVKIQRDFEKEKMFFKLTFERQENGKPYRLANIYTKYRRPIAIYREMIKDVNVLRLEEKMSAVDWESYWQKLKNREIITGSLGEISDIYSDISKILSTENSDDRELGLLLMYKHWPEEMFDFLAGNYEFGVEAYERNMACRLDEYPYLTAERAFLMMSERIDSLENIMMELEIPETFEEDIRNSLYKILEEVPDHAELNLEFNTEDKHLSLAIALKKTDGWYSLGDYTIQATDFPPIAHGVFNGVDSEHLDKKLSTIDWRDDPHLVSLSEEKEEFEFDPEVEEMEEELWRLALDPTGKIIVDQLRVKHFLGAPYFEATINDEAFEWLASLPKKTTRFPVDIPVPQAIHMMSGRPVHGRFQEWNRSDTWLKVDYQNSDTGNIVSIEGIAETDLEAMVDMLPVNSRRKANIVTDLKSGKRVGEISTYRTLFYVELSTDARTLQLYNHQGKFIPFNFRLDPNWNPVDTKVNSTQVMKEKQPATQRKVAGNGKRKGKNL